MSKELFVSSTPSETKVAIVEEDQLTEVYFERENEYTLAGSIYKGRVTRVLPGMQSAFVNVGLERDAFLYVSDFLLDEDEDADVLEQVTSRVAAEVEAPEARAEFHQHPIEAQEVFPAVAGIEGGGPAAAEAAVENDAGGDDPEREGARRWKGRRRRGRGRDRFPERGEHSDRDQRSVENAQRPSEYVQRSSENAQRPSEHGREQRSAEPVHEPRTEAPSGHQPSGHQAMVLPGESISKYQPHSPAPASARTQAPPAPQYRVKPSTEYSVDSSQFSPGSMVLPGESLSKYRHGRASAPAPVETAVEVAQHHETPHAASHEAEAFAPREIKTEEHHAQVAAVAAVADFVQTHPLQDKDEDEDEVKASLAVEVEEDEQEENQQAESMHAVAVSGDESLAIPEQQEVVEAAPLAEIAEPDAGPVPDASPYVVVGGVIEEEVIEEEESELPEFDDEFLDLAEFEELEEEELAPADDQMVPLGSDITEAVRDAHVNERATGQYEAEGLEVGEEGEELQEEEGDEENGEGEGAELAEGAEDLEGARAEARAPGSTAGYQQRTDRRPDRRPNRRVGRRMRGRPRPHVQRTFPAISDLLKEGQEILVQIAKEPIAKKGARITSHIALPGRFLVYMPTVHHTGVSRKIASEEERHRLKRIVLSERGEAHGGFIVRTAASGANEDDLRADIRFLINLWNEIRGRAEQSKAPALIYHDLNLVERILRDQVTINFSSIWVDTEQEYERILRFVSRFQPSLVKRVKLYTKETPLFEQFNISDEINKALKSKVWLKSGGYIVINQTEALVAIDVNTGKYVGKTARLEDTIVKTNIDAIREIVRQIRLRDLGGIIVIDFIDMDERKNRHRVMQALEDALKSDRAPSKVLQFNDFGLVAITRKRVKQSLERTLGQQCPICTGTGMIKSVATVCNEIYVEMRKMARHFDHDIMLRVNPEVAKALKAGNAHWLQEMEELTKQTILVKSDPLLHPEQFDMQ
ncbi:MAG TPA: Rne/Rng family ribonuclease [Candidatus Angelobacter sp.]|nr:Rne/Rng family ribonuclease [Candidatus Angelobacter sp.]